MLSDVLTENISASSALSPPEKITFDRGMQKR